MNKILIASFDMEVGGVERSLISLLNHFDYSSHEIDLMLYRHTGDLIHLLPEQTNLLSESSDYQTFRMSIGETLKAGKIFLGITRLLAKYQAGKLNAVERGYKQMQYMWKYALPFLPKLETKYDVAISYLWPHYFVANKVEANIKLAWIHTDFSTVDTDVALDQSMWDQFDHLIAVSNECKEAFIKKYPLLKEKVTVIENIKSPDFVKKLALEKIEDSFIEDERFNIITVARLSYAKGIDQAIKALKLIKERGYHQIVWYVVGYGGDEKELQELIARSGLNESFILLGKKTNPYPYIKAADLYVQPSRYEGKALTVGEAQILAKPVLITNYPTAPSQITNGVDGIICELSVEGIANGIEHLYNNSQLREKLINTCNNTDYHNHKEIEKLYKLV